MKKVSTIGVKQSKNFVAQRLTMGLDLGDRSSWYCVLDDAGSIVLEQKLSTTAKAMREVFGGMPHSRIALETGMHSPWVSRRLSELGHEVIVAHARSVRLIGESRKKDDRLDAQTLARLARIDPQLLSPVKHRSAKAQADLTVIRARGTGASADGAGKHGPRTGQELRGTVARVQCAQYESGKGRRAQSRVTGRPAALAGGTGIAERANWRVQRTHRATGTAELSAGGSAEADQGRGHADCVDVSVDAGRPASFPQKPGRGLLSGIAAGTQELGAEPAADAHQQGR